MKQMLVNELAVLACLVWCVGCSSTKPAPGQPAAAVTTADQKQMSATHDSPTARFVNAWLKGQAPPPDFSMGGGDGYSGWTWFGMILQCAGTLLVSK